MTAWMLFSLLCALELSLAAYLAERTLLAGRAPVRGIWVCALILSVAIPAAAYERSRQSEPTVFSPVADESREYLIADAPPPPEEPHAAQIAPSGSSRHWGASLSRFDGPSSLVWVSLSALLALNFLGGLVTLGLMRRSWKQRIVLGSRVYLSDDVGPAVVGVLSPMIVLPRWVLDLPTRQLDLMLRHEDEHRSAGDGRLLTLVELALVAMPWNVALWWQVMRLRAAVELDCDARVLRDHDPRSYGDLLLKMAGQRRGRRLMGATAFAERAVHLERRIRLLARHPTRARRSASVLAGCIGLAAVTIAWVAPRPPADARADAGPVLVSDPATHAPSPPESAPALATLENAAGALPPPIVPAGAADVVVAQPSSTTEMADACVGSSQVDAAFTRLFTGIPLTREVRDGACGVLVDLEEEQRAQVEATRAAGLNAATAGAALRAQRDSALRALLNDDASRSLLAARVSPGPRGGSAGGSGVPAGAARGGGPRQQGAERNPEVAAQAIFLRLFEGIELTDSQRADAKGIIQRAQEGLDALRPVPQTILRLDAGASTVSIRQPADARLLILLPNESERSLLRSRIVPIPR